MTLFRTRYFRNLLNQRIWTHGEVWAERRKRKNNNKIKRKWLQDNETAEDDLRYYPGKQVFQLQRNLCSGIKARS